MTLKILSSSTDSQFTQTKVEIETILQQQKSRSSEDERRAMRFTLSNAVCGLVAGASRRLIQPSILGC